MFIIIEFWLISDRPSRFFFRARFTFFRTHASLLTFFVCFLSYFIIVVPIYASVWENTLVRVPHFTCRDAEWYLLFSDSVIRSEKVELLN